MRNVFQHVENGVNPGNLHAAKLMQEEEMQNLPDMSRDD